MLKKLEEKQSILSEGPYFIYLSIYLFIYFERQHLLVIQQKADTLQNKLTWKVDKIISHTILNKTTIPQKKELLTLILTYDALMSMIKKG